MPHSGDIPLQDIQKEHDMCALLFDTLTTMEAKQRLQNLPASSRTSALVTHTHSQAPKPSAPHIISGARCQCWT